MLCELEASLGVGNDRDLFACSAIRSYLVLDNVERARRGSNSNHSGMGRVSIDRSSNTACSATATASSSREHHPRSSYLACTTS